MNKETFKRTEAESKVGKRVQTRVEFALISEGSTGLVISADLTDSKTIGDQEAIYDAAIQWDSEAVQSALAKIARCIERADENENPIERFFKQDQLLDSYDLLAEVQSGKPLVDWFTKAEYECFLDELPQDPQDSDVG